jgi:pimeloyl-ACP methyl ester carboxylesterase
MKRYSSVAILLFLALSFGGCSKRSVESGTVVAADGTTIRYESRGHGIPALVFIHCWSCNRQYWDGQIEEFAKEHQVVTLDLGGHGDSGKERKDWTVKSFVQDVQAVLHRLKIKQAILIGHSMGGPIALLVAAAEPEAVKAVICVDTLQNAEAEPPKAQMKIAADQMEIDLRKVNQAFLPTFFYKDSDPKTVAWVVDQASKADPKIAAALMRDLADFDLKAAMSAAKVPIRCINSAEKIGPVFTDAAVNKKYADFEAILMPAVGHFPQLEKPAQFNGFLRQILEQLD